MRIVLLLSLIYVIGVNSDENGIASTDNTFPWHAHLIKWNLMGSSEGSGAFIGNKVILTTAENIIRPYAISVGIGSNIYKNMKWFEVQSYKLHPDYNLETLENNIALMWLDSMPENVEPINLPRIETITENIIGTITGFGLTYEGVLNQHLHEASLTITSNEKCLLNFPDLHENNFCAVGKVGSKYPCDGDKGAPFIVRENNENILIGIASFWQGEECSVTAIGSFVKISKYMLFILENTEI